MRAASDASCCVLRARGAAPSPARGPVGRGASGAVAASSSSSAASSQDAQAAKALGFSRNGWAIVIDVLVH